MLVCARFTNVLSGRTLSIMFSTTREIRVLRLAQNSEQYTTILSNSTAIIPLVYVADDNGFSRVSVIIDLLYLQVENTYFFA